MFQDRRPTPHQDLQHCKKKPSTGPESGWSPALAGTLHSLLDGETLAMSEFHSEIEKLERQYQDVVYSELVYLLSQLRFEPKEARQHWRRILEHCDAMESQLRTHVDFRVALASYFIQVHPKFQSPKIIEMHRFEEAVYRDELTGLHNYRFFLDRLTHEVDRCTQYGAPLSVVLVDVDYFKRYNDRNGHEAGNQALATLARLLAHSVRKVDIAARYGGEEFALVLPCTPKAGALVLAERARRSIELQLFPDGDDGVDTPLTVSMGIATCPGDSTEVQELVQLADSALYLAKQNGRNRVKLYGRSDRSFRRVPTRLTGRLSLIPGQSHLFTTLDVSEGGMSIRTNRELPIGSLLEIVLEVPGIENEVLFNGHVIQGKTTVSGEFRAGVRILSIAAKDRHVFTNYLRNRTSVTAEATDTA